MTHATSLSDLILRSDESNPIDVRYFNGRSVFTTPTWAEVNKYPGGSFTVFNYEGTHSETVMDIAGEFSPIAYDADRKYPRITPIWDRPVPDLALVKDIQAELHKASPMHELIAAIPYEDAVDVAMSFYELTTIVGVCMHRNDFSPDTMVQFIIDYLKKANGQQAAMMNDIESMMSQFGITGIKFE